MRRRNKAGVIVPRRDDQPHRPVCPFVLVDLQETFTERVDRYPYDGVGLGIEIGPPPKGLGRNGVLLDVAAPAREALLTDVFEYARKVA